MQNPVFRVHACLRTVGRSSRVYGPRTTVHGLVLLLAACTQPLRLSRDDSPVVLSHQMRTAPDPRLPGSYTVKTLYYGSGTDKRRAVYRDSVTLRTKTVNASPFV